MKQAPEIYQSGFVAPEPQEVALMATMGLYPLRTECPLCKEYWIIGYCKDNWGVLPEKDQMYRIMPCDKCSTANEEALNETRPKLV